MWWWKLNESEHRTEYAGNAEDKLESVNEEERSWETVSKAMRDTAAEVLGKTSGKSGKMEEAWWWDEDVQQAVASKREAKKERDLNRCEETIAAYNQANKNAKRAVARTRSAALRDVYKSLNGQEGKRKAIRIAKQKNQDSQDVQQVRQIKSARGDVLTEGDDIKEGWRSYFDQLMNAENERIQREVPAKEEGRVWIVLGEEEVRKALSKMKKGKAVGPDDIPVEAWRALGGKGVTWLTEILCRVMASEKMPDEW